MFSRLRLSSGGLLPFVELCQCFVNPRAFLGYSSEPFAGACGPMRSHRLVHRARNQLARASQAPLCSMSLCPQESTCMMIHVGGHMGHGARVNSISSVSSECGPALHHQICSRVAPLPCASYLAVPLFRLASCTNCVLLLGGVPLSNMGRTRYMSMSYRVSTVFFYMSTRV
eukprot:scaffold88582_cov34-Tisochrysis_lutea.AAC.2